MIPFMKPFIVANPIDDDISFASRALEIRALPELLSVQLTSPTGLDLVNVGNDEPQAQHRNKPWFKTVSDIDGDKGIYVWNETTEEWENLSPVDAAELLNTIRNGVEMAAEAEETAREAKAQADRAKEFADSTMTALDAASTRVDDAETAAAAAQEDYSGCRYGHVTAAVIPQATGVYHYTEWASYAPPLAATPVPVGFITLTGDSIPTVPFRVGVEVDVANSRMRGVAYNVLDAGSDRTVSFMWMIKGNNP